MGYRLLQATETAAWRAVLARFPRIDVCQLPEYHQAYGTRTPGSQPLLWAFEDGDHAFAYPFLLTQAGWKDPEGSWSATGYADISSIYGYSGPLSTTPDPAFQEAAWKAFDAWAAEARVIAEFVRFSPHAGNAGFAHPGSKVETNRDIAVTRLPGPAGDLFASLDSKTRNMIRKAEKAGLEARELDPRAGLRAFRDLYDETMDRNASPEFFLYDDAYWNLLLSLPAGELRQFGVFKDGTLIAGSLALAHRDGALYHLGASRGGFSSLGANNLCLFHMGRCLSEAGVAFLNLGGGRTTDPNDPLLRFKRSNGNGVEKYHIGRRILDGDGYREVADRWAAELGTARDMGRLIFYR